ncbi:hypothetical protein HK104_000079 [Borealophlyctis nickersoniae]|nr:hypothetical protein HK104_000079 [Borealophlyctis nickersoniae]
MTTSSTTAVAAAAAAAGIATVSLLFFAPTVKRHVPVSKRRIKIPPAPSPLEASTYLSASWSFLDQSIHSAAAAANIPLPPDPAPESPSSTGSNTPNWPAHFASQVFATISEPAVFDPSAGCETLYPPPTLSASTGAHPAAAVVVKDRVPGRIRFVRVPANAGGKIEGAAAVGAAADGGTQVVRWVWEDDKAAEVYPGGKVFIMEDSFKALGLVNVVIRHRICIEGDPAAGGEVSGHEGLSEDEHGEMSPRASVVVDAEVRVAGPVGLGWIVAHRAVEKVERGLDDLEGRWKFAE